MKAIGGFFELELSNIGHFPHNDGCLVNSGRNALQYILESLPKDSRVRVPNYTCDVVFNSIAKTDVTCLRYDVNSSLELDNFISLDSNEYIVCNNYFGIKDSYVDYISSVYGEHLIIDDCQALFHTPINNSIAFYSPRKYVGIPDGGIIIPDNYNTPATIDTSFNRMSHLLKRLDLGPEDAYGDFRENSHILGLTDVCQMSKLTRAMLNSIDWESVRQKRRNNFATLHNALAETNRLQIPSLDSFECPMVYPYMTSDSRLRKKLIDNKIFVATYWPGCLSGNSLNLSSSIIPLPIDQRYGKAEMEKIIGFIIP